MNMEKEETQVLLEINLISAQGLKPPSSTNRRLQTYAIAWVDPAFKLRTRPDPAGAENPTWNEKFLFRVSPAFLRRDTSAVSVEIYAAGRFSDPLLGTVRFLLSTCLSGAAPTFTAVQVRRPSGRFHGVLNIAAAVVSGLHFGIIAASSSPAICLRDLPENSRRRGKRKGSRKSERSFGCESLTAASSALKEWNGGEREEKVGKGCAVLDGRGRRERSRGRGRGCVKSQPLKALKNGWLRWVVC